MFAAAFLTAFRTGSHTKRTGQTAGYGCDVLTANTTAKVEWIVTNYRHLFITNLKSNLFSFHLIAGKRQTGVIKRVLRTMILHPKDPL